MEKCRPVGISVGMNLPRMTQSSSCSNLGPGLHELGGVLALLCGPLPGNRAPSTAARATSESRAGIDPATT